MRYEFDEIKRKVNVAIGILFKNDSCLLEIGANERSVSHKLAEYLQIQFPDWHVDCEYNRKGDSIKRIGSESRIYPDIIIHQRGVTENLLMMEIKTSRDMTENDYKKLKALTGNEYEYQWGLFAKFNGINQPDLEWYENGKRFKF